MSNPSAGDRVEASEPEPTVIALAEEFVRSAASDRLDPAKNHLAMLVERVLHPDGTHKFPFNSDLPDAERLCNDVNVNTSGKPLSEAQLGELDELIAVFDEQIQSAKRDEYLAMQMNLFDAVDQGRYVERASAPMISGQPRVKSKVSTSTVMASHAGEFTNKADMNVTMLPGAHPGVTRLVVLTPAADPLYFRTLRLKRQLYSEFRIATRSLLLK